MLKVRGEIGVQCSGRYAGAAVPRLQKLMTEAAKAATPILEEDEWASVGTALLDGAHDLQGSSSEHRVSGR